MLDTAWTNTLLMSASAAIPLLPLLAAFWIAIGFMFGWKRGEPSEKETALIAITSASISLLLLIGISIYSLIHGAPGLQTLGTWLQSGHYTLNVSFLLDPLSLSVGTTIALIILLTLRFSVNYLHREPGFQRFFIVLCLFNSAMMMIILAGNAWISFFGWEIAGVSSYLLIAYAWHRNIATKNATRAFISNRLGDAGFILALFVSLTFLGSTDWETMFTQAPQTTSLMVGVAAFGFMVAALVKSAQFPFSAWITRALEGPTPSTAVFYGSVMIHAGVYLLIRIHPLLEQAPFLMYLLIIIGILTIIYAWLCGLVQTDIKTSLMFATLAQVGIMMIWIGMGWYTLATVHLILHAIWRAYQFLHAPSFIQQTHAPAQSVPEWLSRHRWIHHLALNRFYLDPLADWLLVNPTKSLAHDAHLLDEQVIDRMSGTPAHSNMLTTLKQMQELQQGKLRLESPVGKGSGIFGSFMQWTAEILGWFEERLILKGAGDGLMGIINLLGEYLEIVDRLLRQPRYLLVLIAVTLVIVL